MPSFNTHWLVAMKCTKNGGLPDYIVKGFDKYKTETQLFKNKLNAIYAINDVKTANAFFKKDGELDAALDDYNAKLTNAVNYDDITCFSAYMLGACGPDFWTVPSGKACSMAGIHFDLGHYNRTHRQFQVAIKRWENKSKNSLQVKVEQAYFYGMATHIAADCVVHQLVNVSAGAYDLLEGKWSNEQSSKIGTAQYLVHKWNTHNKVENYWDSYIRYRYIGDTGHLFNSEDGKKALDNGNWMTVLNFPTTEAILCRLRSDLESAVKNIKTPDKKYHQYYLNKITALNGLIKGLKEEENKVKIEKPFLFPRIFCDRVMACGDVQPFIYDIVVNKKKGAYPGKIIDKDIATSFEGEVFRSAIVEANHAQMEYTNPKTKKTIICEANKLRYFSSKQNKGMWLPTSFNFLNYMTCPDLAKVRLYGWNVFYDTNALGPFTDSAMKAAVKFIECLNYGMAKNDPNKIGLLGSFWNLDTGLGLKVVSQDSKTRHEVITELRFIHINYVVTAPVNYPENVRIKKLRAPLKLVKYEAGKLEGMPFKTHAAVPFKSIDTVEESDEDQYFELINLKPRQTTPEPASKINSFFVPRRETNTQPMAVKTESQTPVNVFSIHNIKYRLNLLMNVPIAVHYPEKTLGFELRNYNEKTETGLDETYGQAVFTPVIEKTTKNWLKTTKLIDRIETEKDKKLERDRFELKGGMCFFKSRIFINFEKTKDNKRIISKGTWNNVIEYEKHKSRYSRNYCIGTGRTDVLKPKDGGNFNAMTDFKQYSNISPTEKVFFSLYALVRTTNDWYDILSKETVSKDQLEKITRIESLGFVKIVLFYELTKKGATQLKDCYIDGLPVRVDA